MEPHEMIREGRKQDKKDKKDKDKDYTGLVGCTALAFVLNLNTLNAGFVYDDSVHNAGHGSNSSSPALQ
ncbi:hypothetical protein ACLKA6_016873 [Drosophila palustris]